MTEPTMAKAAFNTAQAPQPSLTELLFRETAADSPDLLKMKALIDAGADVNARNAKNQTVLMAAVNAMKEHAAALLIDNGADMYARTIGNKPDGNAMFLAIAHYDLDMVRVFLDKGFDPNRDNCRGDMTALMWAANLKRLDIAEELARRGADINAKTPDGHTAMDFARDNNKGHIADRLIAIDADNKERARLKVIEDRLNAEKAAADAARAELDAKCAAGLPVECQVKAMKRIVLKPKPRMRA